MMRRADELQQTMSSQTKSSGKLPENYTLPRGDFDHQMELDEQLQRESGPPTIPPLSVPGPLSFSTSDKDGINDSMDTSPDQNTVPAARQTRVTQNSLLNEAIEYGKELKAEFSSDPRPAVKQMLQDIFALLGYSNIRESIISGLIDSKGRAEIAEDVNAAILGMIHENLTLYNSQANIGSSIARQASFRCFGESMRSD